MRTSVAVSAFILLSIAAMTPSADEVLDVEDLIREALAASPDLLLLEEVRNERQALLEESRARTRPTLQFLNSYTYNANPPSGFTVEVGELGSIPTGPMTFIDIPTEEIVVIEDQENFSFGIGIQLEQPIYTWGKIRAGIAVREALLELSVLEADTKRSDIATEVVAAVHTLHFLELVKDVLNEQEGVGNRMLEIAEDSRASGQLSETELIETRMEIRELSLAQLSVDERIQNALIDLRYLTGLEDLTYNDLSSDGQDRFRNSIGDLDENQLVGKALKANRNILMSDVAVTVEQRRHQAAKGAANLKPDIAVGVQLGYVGSKIPLVQEGWDTGNEYAATVTLSLSTNLYDGGASAADIDAAASRMLQAGYRAESARREVSTYIVKTLNEMASTRERIQYFEIRHREALELASRQKELLDIGSGSRLEYLSRQMDALRERASVLDQELRYNLRYVALMNVIGNGYAISAQFQ